MYYGNDFLNSYECVAELETAGNYEFSTTIVLKKDGQFFWAYDSGCSCPVPFENFNHEGMLERLKSADRWNEAWNSFESHVMSQYGEVSRVGRAKFLDEVESIINRG